MPYPTLMSSVRLGPVELRNRVISTSHQTGLVEDHLPTEDLVAYQEARARGGVGAVFLEANAVHESALLTSHTIGGHMPEVVPGYERLAEAVHSHGARFFIQLLHGGREQIADPPKAPAVAPSAVPSPRFRSEPRGVTAAEAGELIDGFATSARHAREGGADGVEVSAAHGYLLSQFTASATNRRDDEYNGPGLSDRLRFTREVLAAVREAIGDEMALCVRLSADEHYPGGLGVEECAAVAGELAADRVVDVVSVALGYSGAYAGSSWIAPPPPAPPNAIAEPATRMREAVADLPLIATTRIADLDAAEEIVFSGIADLVGMTRAMIADPELVAKGAAGREREIIPCVGCNQGCIGHYHAGTPIACLVNPRTGREATMAGPAGEGGRSVLVVGAGPAGVAAAVEAAGAGDQVVLAERADEIGGQFRLAGLAPGHRETWARYEDWAHRRLEDLGVEIRLESIMDVDDVDGHDLVVIATGARPFEPDLPDGPGPDLVQAIDALADAGAIRAPALVADWGGGWIGLDAAEALAEAGAEVTYAHGSVAPGEDIHQYQRNLYLRRFDELGIDVLPHAQLATDDGRLALRHAFSGRLRPMPDVATVVIAQGRVPEDSLWRQLEGRPECVRAGDVLGPRSAEEAILEGARVVRAQAPARAGAGAGAR